MDGSNKNMTFTQDATVHDPCATQSLYFLDENIAAAANIIGKCNKTHTVSVLHCFLRLSVRGIDMTLVTILLFLSHIG